ncbi:frequenin-1-like [Branchiostoma lanceolatum]|uniref:frequenin-1-like n=1 Tax=Branchiostoma lanceolatum TaxID=7740 RepID=UPI003451B3B4
MGKVLSCLTCGGEKGRPIATRGRKHSRRMIAQLARKTNFNEKEVRQWQSLFLKDCPDGLLSEDKFVTFYCAFFESVNDEEKVSLARQIFRTFDQDGNGQVDFPEFLRGMSALLRGTTAQRLRWAFSMYDIDNNGVLSRPELLNVLKLMYELQHPRRRHSEPAAVAGCSDSAGGPGSITHLEKLVDRLLSVLDDNNDGHVQMKEFVEGVRKNPQLLTFEDEEE